MFGARWLTCSRSLAFAGLATLGSCAGLTGPTPLQKLDAQNCMLTLYSRPLSQADYARGYVTYLLPNEQKRCPISPEMMAAHARTEQLQATQEARARAAAEAEAAAATARKARTDARIAEYVNTEKRAGYEPITLRDFTLDGPALAAAGKKVAVAGIYARVGVNDYLFNSVLSFYFALRGHTDPLTMPVILTGAQRLLRSHLLACQSQLSPAARACPVTLVGTASICKVTTLMENYSTPCLVVDSGWWLEPVQQ